MSEVVDQMGAELPAIRTAIPGPASQSLSARLEARECPAFAKRRAKRSEASGDAMGGIVLERGRGANLWDVDQNRYVDLAAGFGSVLLGHAAEPITQAIASQAEVLPQGLGDLYASSVKVELIERLAALHPSPDARVLICQSGADAVTAALKTALLATGRPGVLAFHGAYHGLGYAPLAACGFKSSYRDAFASQLNPHVDFIDYPRHERDAPGVIDAARKILDRGDVGALLVEPVLGRGGLTIPPEGFLASLATLARDRGTVVIADEIWTGLGRSGSMSRMRAEGATFDVLCLGKGLGGSVSISACIASGAVMDAWANGGEVLHTSTHAGAPLACRAALATLDTLAEKNLCDRSRSLGASFLGELRESLQDVSNVVDIRGVGLMIGIELARGELGLRSMRRLLDHGFIVTSGGRANEVVVLTPPLTIHPRQLTAMAGALRTILLSTPS